jgi:hypothetical protein
VVKYEPETFKSNLISAISDATDLDMYYSILESNESKLDYKRYADKLLEIFFVGGLIQAGGVILEPENNFCVFLCQSDAKEIDSRIEVLVKLCRRFRYLLKHLEDCFSHLLRYINKFVENATKLSISFSLLVTAGILPCSIISGVLLDHLVKDGYALDFFTVFLQTCLLSVSLDQLTHLILEKNDLMSKITAFFPPNKQEDVRISEHFNNSSLHSFSAYYVDFRKEAAKIKLEEDLHEFLCKSSAPEDVLSFISPVNDLFKFGDKLMVEMVWDAVVSSQNWHLSSHIEKLIADSIEVFSY